MCSCMDGYTHRNFGRAPAMGSHSRRSFGGFGKSPNLVQDASDLTAAGYVVQAPASGDLFDAFGSANRQYVMIGAGALALLVLMKTIK